MPNDSTPHTFLAEARELLRDMENAVLALETGEGDSEAVSALFRAAHTIKGSSGVFGFDAIVEFAHVVEEVLEDLRGGRITAQAPLPQLMLECSDHMGRMLDCLEHEDRRERLNVLHEGAESLMKRVRALAVAGEGGTTEREAAAADRHAAHTGWHVSARFHPDVLRHGMDPLSIVRFLGTLTENSRVTCVPSKDLDLATMDPEACYVGIDLQLGADISRADIDGAFEFVREDSLLCILAPQSELSEWAAAASRLGQWCGMDPSGVVDQFVCEGVLSHAEADHCKALVRDAVAAGGNSGGADAGATRAASSGGASLAVSTNARTVRVGASKLDELINLVGELVIASAGSHLQAQRTGARAVSELTATVDRLVSEVRDRALQLRMVPIGEIFDRYRRVVHDLGRELGKDVQLRQSGADTELDKAMVEKLIDPLMHLVRNALDHGIEPADARVQAGKPARATIHLNAYQDSGNIVVEVSDDGRGLDRGKIMTRALEKGLLAPNQDLTDKELFRVVTEPGFSTADDVTSVSGRGVGMDVVRQNVESLRGSLSLSSRPGAGTCVALRLPLTLAIIDGFVIGVGESSYVVPLDCVVECLEYQQGSGDSAGASGYLNLRDEVLPLLHLRELLDERGNERKRQNIVVVQFSGQRAGFVVDALLGESQTVIKPLGKLFHQLTGFSGTTILGTGEVALVLDVAALVERATAAETERLQETSRLRLVKQ